MSENHEIKEKFPPLFVLDKESIYGIAEEDKDKKEKIQAVPLLISCLITLTKFEFQNDIL